MVGKMKQFFYLHFKEDDDGGVAYSSGEYGVDSAQGPVRFSINGMVQDYQANDLGVPLMSIKLKNILESSVCEKHVWKPSFVEDGISISYEYFIPQFLGGIDVICREKSKIVNGPIGEVIIKACLVENKIGDLEFFHLPNSSIRLIVSDRLKAKIEEGNLTGIDFSTVPVA